MPKVSIHRNQLTLPDELRDVLTSAEDDSLDAEEVDEGLLLRRSPLAQRRAGLVDIRAAQSGVRYKGAAPRPGPADEEQEIADLLATDKAAPRSKKRPSKKAP